MNKHDFVVCYDIADAKRIRKIARCLEKYAFRIQKSVFFYPQATKAEVFTLTNELDAIINQEEDDIRIYHVDVKNSIALESGIDLQNFNLVV